VFLGKTLNSHSASPHPGVYIGTGKFNVRGNPVMDWYPLRGGMEILPVPRWDPNWDFGMGAEVVPRLEN